MFKSPSIFKFAHLKFVLIKLAISISVFTPVQSSRSSSSSAESTGEVASSSSIQATSLVPSSTLHYRDRGDRELISAQFRAAQDAKDLDTSESSISGMEAHHSGLDEDSLVLAKYMAASASTYAPSKMRINRYNQAGFYDPYPAAVFPSSIPSSYYPYNAYSYRDSNPMLDTYPYYERDRIRDLRERAMQAAQSMSYGSGSSSNRDGYGGGWNYREGYRSNDDNAVMSSGHGHDDHGGGGGGWGWKKEHISKVNTNAFGLLGLLGLLSLLSNVLTLFTTTTTTAAMMRRSVNKRSIYDEMEETREQKLERIFTEILPHLTPIAHAKDGIIPMECTFQGVCMANKVLVNELGINGRAAAQRISKAVVTLLEKVEDRSHRHNHKKQKHSSGGKWDLKKKLENAGLRGRNGKNCEKSYPVCSSLQNRPGPSLPFIIRMKDLPELVSKVSRLGGGMVPMNL